MSTSKTVHFEGKFKGKYQAVPYCSQWALSPRYGETTTDKSKVSCTRCAKQLKITPAPKAVSSTRGTCQVCFGGYETRQKGIPGTWEVVLHGYTRPGYGYIQGECPGRGYVPYQISCERTKSFRAELEQYLIGRQAHLAKLQNNEFDSFEAQVKTGNRVPDPRRPGCTTWEYKSIEVPRGQDRTQNPFMLDKPWERVSSYNDLKEGAVRYVTSEIGGIKDHMKILDDAIKNWKLVSFPLDK